MIQRIGINALLASAISLNVPCLAALPELPGDHLHPCPDGRDRQQLDGFTPRPDEPGTMPHRPADAIDHGKRTLPVPRVAVRPPRPADSVVSPTMRDRQAKLLFDLAEQCRALGDFVKARICYEEAHLLSPGSTCGRLAINRLRDLDRARRDGDTAEEQDIPPARQNFRVPTERRGGVSGEPVRRTRDARPASEDDRRQEMLRSTQPLDTLPQRPEHEGGTVGEVELQPVQYYEVPPKSVWHADEVQPMQLLPWEARVPLGAYVKWKQTSDANRIEYKTVLGPRSALDPLPRLKELWLSAQPEESMQSWTAGFEFTGSHWGFGMSATRASAHDDEFDKLDWLPPSTIENLREYAGWKKVRDALAQPLPAIPPLSPPVVPPVPRIESMNDADEFTETLRNIGRQDSEKKPLAMELVLRDVAGFDCLVVGYPCRIGQYLANETTRRISCSLDGKSVLQFEQVSGLAEWAQDPWKQTQYSVVGVWRMSIPDQLVLIWGTNDDMLSSNSVPSETAFVAVPISTAGFSTGIFDSLILRNRRLVLMVYPANGARIRGFVDDDGGIPSCPTGDFNISPHLVF